MPDFVYYDDYCTDSLLLKAGVGGGAESPNQKIQSCHANSFLLQRFPFYCGTGSGLQQHLQGAECLISGEESLLFMPVASVYKLRVSPA